MKFNNWSFHTKIGSGACADVYAIDDQYVIKVVELPTSAKTKKGKNQMRLANSLYAEYMIYQKLYRVPGVPAIPIGAYGETNGFRYLVMQRLHKTLSEIMQDDKTIAECKAAQFGHNIIGTIQTLHEKNIVYVDIKPDNFMSDHHGDIYCVDFGICDSYVRAMDKKHKAQRFGDVVGTPAFLSIDCHQGANCARKDDIEALIYVLIYTIKGTLPWISAKSNEEGASIKKNTSSKELCIGINCKWINVIDAVRNYAFEEKPDYTWIKDQLQAIHEESR